MRIDVACRDGRSHARHATNESRILPTDTYTWPRGWWEPAVGMWNLSKNPTECTGTALLSIQSLSSSTYIQRALSLYTLYPLPG